MSRKKHIRRTRRKPVRKLQQGGHTHGVNHAHPGWNHPHNIYKPNLQHHLQHTHGTGSNSSANWDSNDGTIMTGYAGSDYSSGTAYATSSFMGDFITDEAGAHSGHLFNQNQSVRGGGGPRNLQKRKRPITTGASSGRTVLGPSNPGNNIMWETWELHCPSRNQTLTHNDSGTYVDQLAAISRDCPTWTGSASSHEKGGKVGKPKRRMARGGKPKRRMVRGRKMARGSRLGKQRFQEGGHTHEYAPVGHQHYTAPYNHAHNQIPGGAMTGPGWAAGRQNSDGTIDNPWGAMPQGSQTSETIDGIPGMQTTAGYTESSGLPGYHQSSPRTTTINEGPESHHQHSSNLVGNRLKPRQTPTPINRRGGRTKPVLSRKFQTGGMVMNSGCRHHTSKYDCDSAAGCSWDFSNTCCH